jgi:hypothetical protein
VAGCCQYGDEPSGSGATELVYLSFKTLLLRVVGGTNPYMSVE